MSAHERLNRVRNGRAAYGRLIDRVEELEALAAKTTISLTKAPRGGSGRVDDTWAALIDYRDKLSRSLREYIEDCQALEAELDCIRSPSIKTAMLLRYVDCQTIEVIADKMGYSTRQVYNLLGTGKKIYAKEVCGDDS